MLGVWCSEEVVTGGRVLTQDSGNDGVDRRLKMAMKIITEVIASRGRLRADFKVMFESM
jgi:hypothetical protein